MRSRDLTWLLELGKLLKDSNVDDDERNYIRKIIAVYVISGSKLSN